MWHFRPHTGIEGSFFTSVLISLVSFLAVAATPAQAQEPTATQPTPPSRLPGHYSWDSERLLRSLFRKVSSFRRLNGI